MQPRTNPSVAAPHAMKAMLALENYVENSGLEPTLLELVQIRASQINGCAFCIDLHTYHARSLGESEQRLYLLSGWRESSLYTERERAALSWTEALTLVSKTHASDCEYEKLKGYFSEADEVNLTVLISTINAWNRMAMGFRFLHPIRPQG